MLIEAGLSLGSIPRAFNIISAGKILCLIQLGNLWYNITSKSWTSKIPYSCAANLSLNFLSIGEINIRTPANIYLIALTPTK